MKIILSLSIIAMSAAGVFGLLDMTADIRSGKMIDYEHAVLPSRAMPAAATTSNTTLPVGAGEVILSKYKVVEVSSFFVEGFSRSAPPPRPQLVMSYEILHPPLKKISSVLPAESPLVPHQLPNGPRFAKYDALTFTRIPAPPKTKLRVAALKPDELRIA